MGDIKPLSAIYYALPVWQTMQFALEKCLLAPCENEIWLFASTYRRTEGQVNFLAGNGLLKRSFVEMTSIVVGFNSWALNRFRTSSVASLDTSEYYDFEDWLDNKFGLDCPAGARLVEMRGAYCLSALLHDTMRAAPFEYMTTGHTHLLEHACASNGNKYRSILHFSLDVHIHLSTEHHQNPLSRLFRKGYSPVRPANVHQ